MTSFLTEQKTFQRLANIYAQRVRRLVFLSGAGASREIGLPTWDAFIESLIVQYEQSARGLGDLIVTEVRKAVISEPNAWRKVSILKGYLSTYFEVAVRNSLEMFSVKIPTFYKRVWDLNPDALLSVNLDGLSRLSFDNLRSGGTADYFLGVNVSSSRAVFSPHKKLIVDLHGHVSTPASWILTEEDRDALLSSEGYIQFLRDIFSTNTVVFYGVGVDDISVSGQLNYFSQIDYFQGEYFMIKRSPEKGDWERVQNLKLQIVYLGDDLSWEDGFSRFVDSLRAYEVREHFSDPIRSTQQKVDHIPSPEVLSAYDPDKIRLILSSGTEYYYQDNHFDHAKYREFCERYDNAIHLATRVTIRPPQQ